MSSFIRGAVSKKKRRYQKNGFDLDLTYVTPRIIAMGFPSENVEAAFRNPMKEVLRFLDSFHKDHYKVYNLCSERSYDPEKFYKRVECFPFDDHNAPPFDMILQFCQNVAHWLQEDEKNIAVIHCKAGKGRTGLMIAAWMVYSKEWATAKDALTFYAAMRTYNQKGVTIPSQIRYVHYFAESLEHTYETKTVLLHKILFHTLPKVVHLGDVNFTVYVGKTHVFTFKEYEEKSKKEDVKKEKKSKKTKKDSGDKSDDEEDEELATFECGNIPLCGDIRVEFTEKGSKVFAFWFCSNFVKDNRLLLRKEELDKAHKDTSHKNFQANFRVELVFSDINLPAPDQAHRDTAASHVDTATSHTPDNITSALPLSSTGSSEFHENGTEQYPS